MDFENHMELLREIKPFPFLALRYADEMAKRNHLTTT